MTNWHTNDISQILSALDSSSERGLTSTQATECMLQYGFNELIERCGRRPLIILWEQLTATMVLILIGAAVVAGLFGDYKTTISILAIVILNTFLGFIQQYRAKKTIAVLKKISVPNVHVLRNGKLQEISARDLVPGDVIQLETGNIIPADVRLLEAVNLRIQEATLTGKSEPIAKHTAVLSGEDLPLSDRRIHGLGCVRSDGIGEVDYK